MTSRGGGAPTGVWSRGGLPSRPGSAHALSAPSTSTTSSFPSSSSFQAPQPSSSASAPAFSGFSNRGSHRGGSSNGIRGGRGGGNALSRMEALVDEGDPEAGEDQPGPDSEGLALGGEEDDEGKAHARSQRFNKKFEGNMFEKLHVLREQERKQAIANGEIDDPDNPNAPKRIGSLKGTCTEMCPRYEREEREHKFNVDKFELLAGTTNRIDHSKAVKMFHRPAAGNEQALPSDVRTPETLRNTLDYLFTTLLGEDPELKATHSFIRDRTRSIRQDFSVQSEKSDISIECHERMARYHIHALHVLCAGEGFSVQQEMEQMKKVFQSLDQFYTDRRTSRTSSSTTPSSPHEAEFCAYLLLAHIWDTDILRKTEALPPYLFYTPEVQLALSLTYMAQRPNDPHAGRSKPNSELSQNFFTRFFKTVQRGTTPYLVACLVESHFGDVRKAGLLALKKSFLPRHGAVAVEDLVGMLGCDDVRDVAEVCEEFGLKVTREGSMPVSVEINREAVIVDPRQNYAQRHSRRVVDSKRSGWTNIDIIDGLAIRRRGTSPVQSKAATSRPAPSRIASKSSLSAAASSFQPRPSPLGTTQPIGSSAFETFLPSSPSTTSQPSSSPFQTSSTTFPPPQKQPSSSPFGFSAAPAPSSSSFAQPPPSTSLSSAATPFVPRSVPASTSTLPPASTTPKHPPPAPKLRPKPTISSSTVTSLATALLDEAVLSTLTAISSSALASQQRLLDQQAAQLASGLSQHLTRSSASFVEEQIDGRVKQVGMEVLADEQGRRWTRKNAAKRLMEVGELRKGRRVRLEKRRRDEEGMGLSMSRMKVEPEEYWEESEEEDGEHEDEEMADVERRIVGDYHENEQELVKSAQNLAAFHKPSTFLDFLAQHLSSLVPPPPIDEDLLRWDVLLSTTTDKTAPYLRMKLGLEGSATLVSASGRSVEVSVGEDEDLIDSEEIGLVIFEIGHGESWSPEDDVARLEDALNVISEDNLVATSLLIVSWDSPDRGEAIEDALDIDNLPIPYDRIKIAYTNVENTDEVFSSAVKELVRKIGSIKVRMVSPEDYMEPLQPVWMDLLAFGVDVLALEPVDWDVVVSTFNDLLDSLNEFSSGVLHGLEPPEKQELAFPPFAPAVQIHDNQSASRALQEYLELSRFVDDFSFDLIRCDLRDARLSGSSPPYRAVLETLFNSVVEQISTLEPVRLSSLKDDDLLEWFTGKTRDIERGFQKVLDQHRKDQEAAEAVLKENESRSNVMLVDVVVTSTPVKNSLGKRPRRPTDEDEPVPQQLKGGGGAEGGVVENPLQKLRRLTAEAKSNWL